MARKSSGKRYAQAIFELAQKDHSFNEWKIVLEKLSSLTENEKLMNILDNPNVSLEDKTQLLKEHLPDTHPQSLNLALLLLKRRRLKIVPAILSEFQALVDESRKLVHAEVTTAQPLDADTLNLITNRLQEISQRQVEINLKVNPQLIGGVKIKIGDWLIDGSIYQRLQELRKSLVS